MKTLIVNCDFNGVKSPIKFYYGKPKPNRHPIYFQLWYINTFRGGICPDETVQYLHNMHEKAKKCNLDFDFFCYNELKIEYKPMISVDSTKLDETTIETVIGLMFKKISSFVYMIPDVPDFYDSILESYIMVSQIECQNFMCWV